jgi:hypothetical protein
MNKRLSNGSLLRELLFAVLCLAASCGWGQVLYYATSSATQGNNTVEDYSFPGSANNSIFTATGASSNGVIRCTAIAVDSFAQKVFLLDSAGQKVWSLNENGTGLTDIATISNSTPTDLALDTANHLVYFTTSSTTLADNTIQRMTYAGASQALLFTAGGSSGNGVGRCTALALDTLHSQIIFSDAGSNALWSIASAGGSLSSIKTNLLAAPLDLALDVTNQLIYYVTSSTIQDSNTVQRVQYNGAANTLLLTAAGGTSVQRCTALEFDPVGSKLYLADAGASALWSLHADGSSLAKVEGVPATPRRLKFLPASSQPTVPTVTCPPQIITNYNPADCGQLAAFAPVATGVPTPVVTSTLNGVVIQSPYVFPVGTNLVISTATNSVGSDQCSFAVIVIDTNPPVAGTNTLGTYEGTSTSEAVAKVLARDSAPSKGTLSIISVTSPTSNNATVTLSANLITYLPAPSFIGLDTLTYTLSDGCGTTPGTILVTVLSTNLPTQNQVSITLSAGGRTVVFAGVPNASYEIESASSVTGPWSVLSGVLTAATNGLVQYTDATMPIPPVAFYRTKYISGP